MIYLFITLSIYNLMLASNSFLFYEMDVDFKKSKKLTYDTIVGGIFTGLYSISRGLYFYLLLFFSIIGFISNSQYYMFFISLFILKVLRYTIENKYIYTILTITSLLVCLYASFLIFIE